MTYRIPACMGGWCPVREQCQWHQMDNRTEPAERLCPKGTHGAFIPVAVPHKPQPQEAAA